MKKYVWKIRTTLEQGIFYHRGWASLEATGTTFVVVMSIAGILYDPLGFGGQKVFGIRNVIAVMSIWRARFLEEAS